MEITERQLKELCDIASAIDDENRIDDDVSGGYVEEPYKSIIDRIYAVVNECDRKEVEASKNTLPIQNVSRWAYLYDSAKPLMTGFIAAMLLNTTYQLIETIIIKIALIINGS